MKLLLSATKFIRRLKGGLPSVEELRKYGMTIGDNCHIYTNKIDYGHAFLISMGNNVTISDARLLTHDGSTKKVVGYSRIGRIDIGDDVFIGADVIVLPNVKIGSRVIVGAGSVVTKDIPDDSIAVGNPARVVGTYSDFEKKNQELIKQVPVYETPYYEKTAEEKAKIKEELRRTGCGFDW